MNKLPFTQDEMQQVFDTNLIEYAMSQGFEMKQATDISYYIKGFGGLHVFDKGFHCFSDDSGGHILKFAELYQGLKGKEAIENILGIRAYTNTIEFKPTYSKPKIREDLILPEKDNSINEVVNYLTRDRCLDRDIVKDLYNQNLIMQVKTEFKGMVFKNCAFVSFDFENKEKPMFCALRGLGKSNFKQDVRNSNKSLGFKMQGTSNKLFVFESPIDAISHATISKLLGRDYTRDSRISTGGLTDKSLEKFLEHNKNIENIVFCFDNDFDKDKNYGQEYAQKCSQKYESQGFRTSINKPILNDFNTVLQNAVSKQQEKQKSIKSKIVNFKKDIVNKEIQSKNKNNDKGER